MTISDARKRSEPCPGVDRCQTIMVVMDHEFGLDDQAADAIRETCAKCGRGNKG